MKTTLLLLTCAGALSMAACSQEKTTDTTTTTMEGGANATATTTSDETYRTRANTVATRMASDMKIQDTATVSRMRTAYYNRARRMDEMRSKYTSDTTGMYRAMRDLDMETDQEFKTILTDPTQYSAYESNRTTYYDDSAYGDDASMSASGSDMSTSGSASSADMSSTSGSSTEGGKLKVKRDGDVKIKDAQGNKTKVDGDDGTLKSKPEDGGKSVIR
ncbi:hypothetical protein LJY25_14465 [Hymenobacter sp. BT175]|uniref:hypothetical protein n=1 Tax=Hymenobacter translucens TaxID=2886507 RepID=UPI001D0E59A3|nr:hypothetical protein [Hymenobacter translucens]MCC2547655.1 hypothetical protein [Hymenobacter translucens]